MTKERDGMQVGAGGFDLLSRLGHGDGLHKQARAEIERLTSVVTNLQNECERLMTELEQRPAVEPRVSRCTCIPAVTHDDYCATKSSAYQPPPPDILADALQDVVHTDPGPVRAAHAVRKESDWHCTHCGRDNDPTESHCVQCEWSRRHTIAGVLHERGCGGNPCRCGAVKSSAVANVHCNSCGIDYVAAQSHVCPATSWNIASNSKKNDMAADAGLIRPSSFDRDLPCWHELPQEWKDKLTAARTGCGA